MMSQRNGQSKAPSAYDCSAFDPNNLLSIVRHLVVFKGQADASLDEIKSLYGGDSASLSIQTLCGIAEVAITPEMRFLPIETVCQGNLKAISSACMEAAKSCQEAAIKAKFVEQLSILSAAIDPILPDNITFGLRQKWIPYMYLQAFLQSRGFAIRYTDGLYTIYGKEFFDHFPSKLQKYLNGFTVKGGTRQTTIDYIARIEFLEHDYCQWLREHQDLHILVDLFNDTYNTYAGGEFDSSPLDIQGFLSGKMALHPYQNSAVRRLFHEGRGICAYDVGLGKSFISLALAAWQYKQNNAAKTCIVVPNSVLVNWHNEAREFFCEDFFARAVYFVGLDKEKNGCPARVCFDTERIKHDYAEIARVHYPIVIMTREKFVALGVGQALAEQYLSEMAFFCPKIATPLKKILAEQNPAMPNFENFGFTSLHLDEAHAYKNCLEPGPQVKSIRYLSTPPVAKTALNAAVKAFAIRQQNKGVGVYCFTATPVTNSPFEVLNSTLLVSSPKELLELEIKDMESFISLFGNVKMVPHVSISNTIEIQLGLVGFTNLDALRNFYARYVYLKSGDDVDAAFSVVKPFEHEELVPLSQEQRTLYDTLRKRALKAERGSAVGDAREQVFSVIRDMDRLTLDEDYLLRKITYLCDRKWKTQLENALLLLPENWPTPEYCQTGKIWVTKTSPLNPKITQAPNGMCALTLPEGIDRVAIKAFQQVGLNENAITHPLNPKYQRLMERVRDIYFAGEGKQLIFTDEKEHHAVLSRIIAFTLNIPLANIGIINADESSGAKLDKLCRKYNQGAVRIIIANRKAELGVNLQEGTTAIHHLTIPWTPASVKQRNGRGVRQGNMSEHIDVYYYYGENTFDSYRHKLLRVKENWIGELLTGKLPVMPNGDIMSTEELLDMLANDPDAATRNREKRMVAAKLLEKRERERSMFVTLNQLACLHATTKKKRERLISQAANNQKEFGNVQRLLQKGGWDTELPLHQHPDMPHGGVSPLAQLASDPRQAQLLERLHECASTKRKIEDELLELEARFSGKKSQLIGYLHRMAATGQLPFPLSFVEEADTLMATSEGVIYRLGELWERTTKIANDKSRVIRIAAIDPVTKVLLVEQILPEGPGETGEMQVACLAFYQKRAVSDYLFKERWKYGLIPKSAILTRQLFEEHCSWLQFNMAHGMVCRVDGALRVQWSKQQGTPSFATPVWPEPENLDFRKAVFQQYLEEKREPYFCPNLMTDLFGEDYDAIALTYCDSPETELMRILGNTLTEARHAGLLDGLSPEELLRKIQAFSEAEQKPEALRGGAATQNQ